MPNGHFLAGVSAVIYHAPDKTYLLLHRAEKNVARAGTWECVTGHVDQGESFPQALHREVREELGVAVHVEFVIGTTHFFNGPSQPEYELLGVRYACQIDTDQREHIRYSEEHVGHRWLTAEQLYAFLPPEHWLVQSIRQAEVLRALLPAGARPVTWEG